MKTFCTYIIASLLSTLSVHAASYVLQFKPDSVIAEQDTFYADRYRQPDGSSLDTTSRVYTSTSDYDETQPDSPTTSLVGTMRGVTYDGDPVHGSEWGLLDPSEVPFTERPTLFQGFVVKYGKRPVDVGRMDSALTDANGATSPASYIDFRITSNDEILFKDLSLTMTDLSAIEPTDVTWAGTNRDGYTDVTRPTVVRDDVNETSTLTFNWENVNLNSKELLIRVYGIKGSDYGNFTAGVLRGTVVIPEPSVGAVALLSLWALNARSRRRKSSHS